MTLMEHLQELRSRLFKASLGVVAGFIVGFFVLAQRTLLLIERPYCDLMEHHFHRACAGSLQVLGPTDAFLLSMKIGLWLGLIIAAPVWLYQLWAFIAPGLHRHERRWAYAFVAAATPLFAMGAVLAYFVVAKGLQFLLSYTPANVQTNLEFTRYVDFIVNLMLLFGVALEFPLVVVLFNVAGLASAQRLLSWWRVAVFLFFAFSAIATPTPDPFGMSALALVLSALYFAAVGFAFVNDKRRARRHAEQFGDLADDQISPLEYTPEPVDGAEPVSSGSTVERALPLDRSYDDYT
jgi:sec-independent protein translocase protein TatC